MECDMGALRVGLGSLERELLELLIGQPRSDGGTLTDGPERLRKPQAGIAG